MTTIRLMDKNKKCIHEFDTHNETSDTDILLFCGRPFIYDDHGEDENGKWEEWTEGQFVDATPMLRRLQS